MITSRKLRGWSGGLGAIVLALLSGVAGLDCAGKHATRGDPQGFILISLSGLRADALGFRAKQPSSSPFLDSLAERALVYEQAITTSPDTLVAHVSLLSGLYPSEHRVVPPTGTLAADVPVLAERFGEYGFRTGGFTSGGYLSSDFGFDRGFDEFEVARRRRKSPFGRAVDFLRTVEDDPFFVFVHSDALEDALLELSSEGERVGQEPPRVEFRRLVSGNDTPTPEVTHRIEAEYLAAVARLDREIESFFDGVDALDLRDRTVVAVTADHGFEFGEHGRLGHVQVYPETLGVPLMIAGPGLKASRIQTLVQTVDIAPSFYSLAGLPGLSTPGLSGVALPGLGGAGEPRRWAAAEVRGRWEQRTLLLEVDGGRYQGIESRLRGEHDGTWVTRQVTFDTLADRLDVSIVSFRKPRTLQVLLDGEVHSEVEIEPDWVEKSLSFPGQARRRRVSLRAGDCESPRDAGFGSDRRCLSFKLRGQELSRFELFDLGTDPEARVDISTERAALTERIRTDLGAIRWQKAQRPGVTRARASTLAAITARAEYPESPRP